jgi:hypothetical protein
MLVKPARHCAMIEALRREGARGTWLALLTELASLAGCGVEFLSHSERPWSSATFSGARHRFRLAFEGLDAVAAGETFITALPDHEFRVRDRLVADAAVTAVDHDLLAGPTLTVEADLLVLEEA